MTTDPRSDINSPITSVGQFGESAFPTVYRREKDGAGIDVQNTDQDDGTVSCITTPGGDLLPERKRKVDRLAPMPENRRLGYLSVGALIINKMIGMPSPREPPAVTRPPPLTWSGTGSGIFSTPSAVLQDTGGSKGAALFLWLLGSVATLAG